MQFRVPQFIDIEDKIFGPLTFKQFIYILGAGGAAFVIWTIIQIHIIAIIIILPVSGLFLALAFVKINERPFIDFVESLVRFFTQTKIYIWKQPAQNIMEKDIAPLVIEATKQTAIEKTRQGRLREIAFGLDVLDRNSQEKSEV